jgi:hypothetical protein
MLPERLNPFLAVSNLPREDGEDDDDDDDDAFWHAIPLEPPAVKQQQDDAASEDDAWCADLATHDMLEAVEQQFL